MRSAIALAALVVQLTALSGCGSGSGSAPPASAWDPDRRRTYSSGARTSINFARNIAVDARGRVQGVHQHGWIGLKVAATSAALANAPERKLFAGAGYDSVNDGVPGAPEFRLDQLFASAASLGHCAAFTEPAILVSAAGIY